MIRLATATAGFAALLATTAIAQTPTAELAKPPATATHYIIESTGGKHGDSYVWNSADGTRMGRESMNLRGQVWETEMRGTAGPNGVPVSMTIRGVTPTGDAAETFGAKGRTASDVDAAVASFERVERLFPGNDAVPAAGFYAGEALRVPEQPTPDSNADLRRSSRHAFQRSRRRRAFPGFIRRLHRDNSTRRKASVTTTDSPAMMSSATAAV